MNTLHTVQIDIENGLEQAQLQRLSHSLFSNDVLGKVKEKIDQTAKDNGYTSVISKTTDLFQIPLSYVYQPGNKTIAFFSHVKHEYLLSLNQYLPFPLSHDLSPNHSLTPSVGQNDILTYIYLKLSKLFHNRILLHVTKWGRPIFARGGMILEQTLLKHVWVLCICEKLRVFKRTANLKLEQTRSKSLCCHTANGQWPLKDSSLPTRFAAKTESL
jgi:hypothetical protein